MLNATLRRRVLFAFQEFTVDAMPTLVERLTAEGIVFRCIAWPMSSALCRFRPDVIVVDSVESVQQMRMLAYSRHCPTLLLSCREDERLRGLQAGAESSLCPQGSIKVLVSQIKALLRTANRRAPLDRIRAGRLLLDRDRYVVIRGDEEIFLPRREFQLLYHLASNPNVTFTRQELLAEVWGTDVVLGIRTVDVHVRKIRRKLHQDIIGTVESVGYCIGPGTTA